MRSSQHGRTATNLCSAANLSSELQSICQRYTEKEKRGEREECVSSVLIADFQDCLQLSHPFSHFEDKGADGVTVHFTNGTSYNADIVVGMC